LGLRGIEKRLGLPYGPFGENGVSRDSVVHLPVSLDSALSRFTAPHSKAREVLGDYLVDHFGGTRKHELEVYRKAVTSWEGRDFLLFNAMRLIRLSRAIFRTCLSATYALHPLDRTHR
jgi:glutamine synthetase